jgi:hypothetical protein
MKDYSVVDRRKRPFLVLDKAIPLAYGPHIGSEAVYLYLIYASIADQGNISIDLEDVKEFLGMNTESLEKCNKILEEYGLVKLEDHERDGRIITNCYVLQPPTLPQTLYQDLKKRALAGYIDDVIDVGAAQPPKKSRRRRQPLITTAKLVTKFYKGMGKSKTDIFEREAGKKHISDLIEAGYSLEDVDFAIEWAMEKARDELEDFSSIKGIIDKAIAEREEHMAKRTQQAEKEVKGQEDEEIESKMVEAYRKIMPESEQKRLRERVMEEIRKNKSIKEEFITEQLIVIMENEIIRKEYLKRGSTGDGA